ncbi:TerC family protein [Adhaeribacter radiodurans]|uniref:TerC family protein n=1 Tax=Adhaeribacter radiodurans TaxID=2745197 RepID=A0A7L7LAD6_9BACT|nr:TerC family protein [Adhaeribacter radiodurans]QMU29674.1 TerC family protein [Adhaeribacter radiodurans]
MEVNYSFWIGYNVFVLLMLALDLGVFNRKAHVVSVKEALTWSGVWICLSLIFNGLIYYWFGEHKAIEFLTGYVIEKALSVDNIFVFVLVFNYFQIPAIYQHKVLFWGILGALLMRVIFIFAGVALIEKFHWTIYLFGVFLVYTGYKMFTDKDKKMEPEKNPIIKFSRRIMPITNQLEGDKFFVTQQGKVYATPLFLVLILIEATDLIFAVDSIPAILAITQDQFIVYTSNVFAILGLRSLYFALAHVIHRFIYLSTGLAVILIFVGLKMVLIDVFKIPTFISLIVIGFIITISIVFSLLKTKDTNEPMESK